MREQMVVFKLSMKDHKSRAKAFKIVVSQAGVKSASISAQENQLLKVVGQLDVVELSTMMKKMGEAKLLSDGAAGGDKTETSVVN